MVRVVVVADATETLYSERLNRKILLFNIGIYVLYKILTIIIQLIQKYGACVFVILVEMENKK